MSASCLFHAGGKYLWRALALPSPPCIRPHTATLDRPPATTHPPKNTPTATQPPSRPVPPTSRSPTAWRTLSILRRHKRRSHLRRKADVADQSADNLVETVTKEQEELHLPLGRGLRPPQAGPQRGGQMEGDYNLPRRTLQKPRDDLRTA
ncbi:hypothetical protein E2C01_075721 [Portunus trituberculatus]|uniref:Uncharacterized protein n=1 Tax=Portunus trituberculatus TaxID=210409 RepID=A0A5B7I9B5_PORTR|nr:hypothetical protein [Portunus trituberculatus]